MGWNKVEKANGVEKTIKISCSILKGGARLIVSMPHALSLKYIGKDVDFLEVFQGDGEDAGKLLFVPANEGVDAIKVGNLKQTVVLRLPNLADMQPIAHSESDIQVEKLDYEGKSSFIITLPKWAYDEVAANEVRKQNGDKLPPKPMRTVEAKNLIYPEPDFTSAPLSTAQIWAVLKNEAVTIGRTTVEFSNLALAKKANIDGARIVNAIAWISANKCLVKSGPDKVGGYVTYRLLAQEAV